MPFESRMYWVDENGCSIISSWVRSRGRSQMNVTYLRPIFGESLGFDYSLYAFCNYVGVLILLSLPRFGTITILYLSSPIPPGHRPRQLTVKSIFISGLSTHSPFILNSLFSRPRLSTLEKPHPLPPLNPKTQALIFSLWES